MNRKTKIILTVTIMFFSTLLLALPQPVAARDSKSRGRTSARVGRRQHSSARRGTRGRNFGQHRSGRRSFGGHYSRRSHRRSRYGSNFGIGFGFGFSDHYYGTSHQRWVAGYYETRTDQVLVEPAHYEMQTQQVEVEPGRYEIRQIPAVEVTRHDDKGKAYKIVLEPARTETIWIPPKYEDREVKVWVPDRHEDRQVQVWVPGHWAYYPAYAPSQSSFFRIGGRFSF